MIYILRRVRQNTPAVDGKHDEEELDLDGLTRLVLDVTHALGDEEAEVQCEADSHDAQHKTP